jgi:hypothetical protein
MPNDKNDIIAQLRGFDAQHYASTERYAKQVERLYNSACDEFARMGIKPEEVTEDGFSFDRLPKTKKKAQGILTRLVGKLQTVITTGTKAEWLAACKKNDAFISSILRTTKLTKEEVEQYQSRNLEALNTFQRRKVEGLGLSERVWKYAGELKAAMELGIDVALGEGKSAQELSRDLRGYLQEPDRLYRRVRDKGGNLRLSKAAKLYHPGQGIYRSSAKNAQRLTRTEINMAYRESEFLRWQKLDFVVGFRVMLSNNHTTTNSKGEKIPLVDICDELWGDYPKTFKFTGWHPQCRCFVVPILSDYDEYNQDRANRLKAIIRKAKYESMPSRRTVTDVPKKFRDYIDSIKERAKGWKSMPYYIRDNFKGGKIEGGVNATIPTRTMNSVKPCTEFDGDISYLKRWAYALGGDISNIDALRTAGNRENLKAEIDRVREVMHGNLDKWHDAQDKLSRVVSEDLQGYTDIQAEFQKVLTGNEPNTERYYADCISRLKQAVKDALAKLAKVKEEEAKSGDKPHHALRKEYTSNEQVDETFKVINGELTEKWFENGDLKLGLDTGKRTNGYTYMDGRIYLQKERLAWVKTALEKIAQGKSASITTDEAKGMATFWHEITHNRNKPGNMRLTDTQRRYMELANEFVARKTLPEFYRVLGCKETPQPQFINNRSDTGYNDMVNNYDFVVRRLGLDADKVLEEVRRNLFNEVYSDQLTGLKQGLLKGGLKRLDGKKIKATELKKLLSIIAANSNSTLENWLKINGYLK